MTSSIAQIILRGSLVAVVWLLVWRVIKPVSPGLRVVRAGVLVLSLLLVLVVLRLAGG